jgi:hypothetical protein
LALHHREGTYQAQASLPRYAMTQHIRTFVAGY